MAPASMAGRVEFFPDRSSLLPAKAAATSRADAAKNMAIFFIYILQIF
jgi:hypothetical protein